MAGAQKKKSFCNSDSTSIILRSDAKAAFIEKHVVPSETECGNSRSTLPGIGLHLNALANTSNAGKVVKCESQVSRVQEISTPNSMPSFDSSISGQNPLTKSLTVTSMERDLIPCDNEDKVTEHAPQTSMGVDSEEFDHGSPKKKRHKLGHIGESTACKRCNCKRSKCLKLYCECFAAGLYCIEPCSCQNCLNKPVHEDIVLETRRQIESRNPIAFAPKVIKSTDPVSEFGHCLIHEEGSIRTSCLDKICIEGCLVLSMDETNKTPASARHKRGCNCKKSSCLKKYCECFQGGVGCSVGCRCEGCKNPFGRKDGPEEPESEGEESEAREKNASDISLHDSEIKRSKEEHPNIPAPPKISRTLLQPVITSNKKFPRSSLLAVDPSPSPSFQWCSHRKLEASDLFGRHSKFETQLQVIPEDDTPPENLGSGVKSSSPNSKRVSPAHRRLQSSNAWRSSRKLILRSVPPFPSLTPPPE